MTKLRKLQRACSLGDFFFKAREVTHDIFLKLKCDLVHRLNAVRDGKDLESKRKRRWVVK